MISINYNNANISYSGRFIDTGVGIKSAFQGNMVRFRVEGTTQVQVVANVKGVADGGDVALAVNIDNSLSTATYVYATGSETFEGERTVTITLPDTDIHDIIIKTSAGMPTSQYTQATYILLKSYFIDDGGSISPYFRGFHRILCLGDSWMGAWNDWIRLMDASIYDVYPVAFGGAKASDIDAVYPYQANGVAKTGDGNFSSILIGLGVNDFASSVSTASFKTSIGSLIDKIRADHPTTTIFLLQAPRNIGASKNFDQYGTVLQQLVTEKTNVRYISTSTMWDVLTWTGDTFHLDDSGKKELASFIATTLTSSKKIRVYMIDYFVDIPLFDYSQALDPVLKIVYNGEIKYFKLVETSSADASILRVYVDSGIKAIAKQ